MVTVTVPATSANVGAGFDSLGLAVSMHNVFTFEESDRIQISSVDGTHVPAGSNNLVYRSARVVYDQLGIPLKGLRITQRNDIPMARGLGSSSACIVAGIMGANALLGDKLTERQMLTLATAIEGHPDNVAPAMLGGFVTSVIDEGQVYSVKKDIDPELAFAAFVPDFRLLTSKARAALPAMVSHKDAVYNLSRAALATAAFCEGNYALLGVATKDVLHQKYRLPLIEGGDDVFELAQDLGAQAVYISGAGPTIMAVVHKDDTEFFTRAEAALAADSPLHHFTVHRLLADNPAIVTECDAVYIGKLTADERSRLFASLTGHPVLSISEGDDQCTVGSLFCLRVGDEQVSFEVNLDSVARSGVRIHPSVLQLSRRKSAAQ